MLAAKLDPAVAGDLIDLDVVAGLRQVFGDRTGALMGRTRQMVVERMGMMVDAADEGACDRVARLAHEIGGMAGQIGMRALCREALALERRCGDLGAGKLPAETAALDRLARASMAALPAD